MAYAAQTDTCPPPPGHCWLPTCFWTIVYDTEYAMVDRDDDLKIGIRTSAILFGRFDVAAVMPCYAVFLATMLAGSAGRSAWRGPITPDCLVPRGWCATSTC